MERRARERYIQKERNELQKQLKVRLITATENPKIDNSADMLHTLERRGEAGHDQSSHLTNHKAVFLE